MIGKSHILISSEEALIYVDFKVLYHYYRFKIGYFYNRGKVGNQQRELKLSRSVTSSERVKEGVD